MNIKRAITAIILALLFVIAVLNELDIIGVDWGRMVLLVTIFIPLAKWAILKMDPPEEEALEAQQKYLDKALSNLDKQNRQIQKQQELSENQKSSATPDAAG